MSYGWAYKTDTNQKTIYPIQEYRGQRLRFPSEYLVRAVDYYPNGNLKQVSNYRYLFVDIYSSNLTHSIIAKLLIPFNPGGMPYTGIGFFYSEDGKLEKEVIYKENKIIEEIRKNK